METSVVVPTHGKRDLKELKDSIPEDVELLIIDRGLERSIQRNMGILAATGKYILILDSDQSVSPNLIYECEMLCDEGYTAIYIPEVIVADSFFGKVRAFERTFYTGTYVDVPRFVMADACPMFSTDLSGPEDAEWGYRIKGKRTVSKNVLYHNDDIGFWDYCKKKAYYTKSMTRYAELCPDDPCLNIWYRCVTVFVENGKWKRLLRHPVLSCCVVGLLFVRGVIYATNR